MVKLWKKALFVVAIMIASVFCIANFAGNQTLSVEIDSFNSSVEVIDSVAESENPEVSIETDFTKGNVIGGGRYSVGATVELVATPFDGCYFVKWQIKVGESFEDIQVGEGIATSPTYTFVMNGDVTFLAVFDYLPYTISSNFTDYFDLVDFDYTYDTNRFNETNLTNYVRANTSNVFVDGAVYYNDVVTIQFANKNDKYVKKLSISNFSFNTKSIATIFVTPDGKLISTEINRQITDYEGQTKTLADAIADGTISFDYDNYTYLVLTQKNVGENYITTFIELKYKVAQDASFNMSASELFVLTINAVDENNTPININEQLSNLIVFDYGYYGVLDLSNENQNYLIENGANYSFSFFSNQFYTYLGGQLGTSFADSNKRGYFNKNINNLVVYFSKVKYEVVFEEYVRVGARVLAMTTPWFDLPTQEVYPGQVVTLDVTNKTITIDETTNSFVVGNVYGYELFAVGGQKTIDTENLAPYSVTIDEQNPTSLTVFIIHKPIDYNLHIGVVDKNGFENEYLKSKISYMTFDKTVNAGDTIALTGVANAGFKTLGWKMLENAVGDGNRDLLLSKQYLSNLNFKFEAVSNVNTDLYYYLFADYEYNSLKYSLYNASFYNNSPMATLGFGIIDYFTLSDDNTLTVFGKSIVEDTILQTSLITKLLDNPSVVDKGNGKVIYQYSTPIGDIEILKNNGENVSLTFASHTYNLDTDKFTKNMTVPVEYNINYVYEAPNYSLEINTTCDDVVICFATNTNATEYKFSYFTVDQKSTLSSVILDDATVLGDYAYIYSYNKNIELFCVFSLRTQNVNVYIQGEGYSIENVEATINNEKDGVNLVLSSIVISAENGNFIQIRIDTTKVESGYQYDGIKTNYEELHPNGINRPQVSKDNNYYFMAFTMSSEYADLDIYICFVEINYTVKIVDESNKGLDARLGDDTVGETEAIVDGEFFVNWSTSKNNPFILISSASGYYISKAYINLDDADHSLNEYLVGVEAEQTVDKKFVFDDFQKYIIDNADGTNTVSIFINQTERTYFVRVGYKLQDKTSAINTQYATITSSLTGESKRASVYGNEYQVIFDKIPYGTTDITLTMDASNVSGIKFASWCNVSNGVISAISTSLSLSIQNPIVENVEFVALFECLEYTIDFKFVHEVNSGGQKSYVEYEIDNYLIGNVTTNSNKFCVGDKINFAVDSKPGYQYVDLYYGYLVNAEQLANGKLMFVYTSKQGIDNGETDNNYSIDVRTNAPNTGFNNLLNFVYPFSTKELQINNENYRKLVVYLIFEEKTYKVGVKTVNLNDINTTGIDVENWIDNNNLSIKYGNTLNGEYLASDAQNFEYSTNTFIEVRFKTSFAGVTLKNIYLADETFVLTYNEKETEHELAGQTVLLSMENDMFVLKFQLTTILLKNVDKELTVSLRYNINQYKIVFSGQSASGVLKNFGLQISYVVDTGGIVSENREDFSVNMNYGSSLIASINLESAKNNLNNKYYFAYFNVNGEKLQQHTSEEEAKSAYSIDFLSKFGDSQLNLWEMNATEKTINIIAMFAPKITLNGFERDGSIYTKIVDYNAEEQYFTTSYDKTITGETEDSADIVYDVTEFEQINVIYINSIGQNAEPKNADKYSVYLAIKGYSFEGEIFLVIRRAVVHLAYKGDVLSKPYDGTTVISDANKMYLSSSFDLEGIKDRDANLVKFDFSQVSGEYENKNVGENKLVKVNGIGLSTNLKQNYEFDTNISDDNYYLTNIEINNIGKITPRTVELDKTLFIFENIVYKPNENYKLKYSIDYDKEIGGQKVIQSGRILVSGAIAGDEVYINLDNDISSIEFVLNDYSVGRNKQVSLGIDSVLSGADSDNYILQDLVYYIDIYPYMLTYTKDNIGTFAIVDKDEKCLIPIELFGYDSFKVDYIDSSNPYYPNYYSIMENNIARDERLHAFYVIHIYSQYGIDLGVGSLKGCYFRLPEVDGTKNIYMIDNNDYLSLPYKRGNDYFEIKLDENSTQTYSLVVDKTYFSIWKIIIIVGAILLSILLIIFIIFIVKRKKQKATESKEKI